jgi:hypothetical protein
VALKESVKLAIAAIAGIGAGIGGTLIVSSYNRGYADAQEDQEEEEDKDASKTKVASNKAN